MCGISGRASMGRLPGPTDWPQGRLAHRGPDDSDSRLIARDSWAVKLDHERLAINDLSAGGRQPMTSTCSSLSMTFNGEIYNYATLRRACEARGHKFRSQMDGEVILHLWEDHGEASLSLLRGDFALAVVDASTGELVLARDALGVKPLYFSLDGARGVAFASEIAPLRELRGTRLSRSPRSLATYLTLMYIPAPYTQYEEIQALRPGELLRWAPGASAQVRTGPHAIRFPSDLDSPSSDQAITGVKERLDQACQRQQLSDVPVGIMASGGVDSSLLWLGMRHSISAAFTVNGGEGAEGLDEDAAAAAYLARQLGTDHTPVPPPHLLPATGPAAGDLIADPAYALTAAVAACARDHGIKVLVSGQGADELFGGYRRHWAARLLGAPVASRQAAARALAAMSSASSGVRAEYSTRLSRALCEHDPFLGYASLFSYSNAEQRARVLDTSTDEVADEHVLAEHRRTWEALPASWDVAKRAMGLDLSVYLPGLGLTYVDRATMLHGVEGRVPWLDRELVEYAMSLSTPTLTKLLGPRKRPVVGIAKRSLPREVWDRPKRGFGLAFETLDVGADDRQGAYLAYAIRMAGPELGLTPTTT